MGKVDHAGMAGEGRRLAGGCQKKSGLKGNRRRIAKNGRKKYELTAANVTMMRNGLSGSRANGSKCKAFEGEKIS